MSEKINPFIFEAATNLSSEQILNLYVDIDSTGEMESHKNVFVEGYRGSGKSMVLIYNSFDMKYKRDHNLDFIGIYISCLTPLYQKNEQYLLRDQQQSYIIDEHMLVMYMAIKLTELIDANFLSQDEESVIVNELNSYFKEKFISIQEYRKYLKKAFFRTQQFLNQDKEQLEYVPETYFSLILPLVDSFSSIGRLKNTRFTFLIDDAQLLSEYQKKTLNSWISFRDTNKINFKIAITSKKEYMFNTSTETVILKDHDYTLIDLEKNFFGENSTYYNFAKNVIEKRLNGFGITSNAAEDFLKEDEKFKEEINAIKKDFLLGKYGEYANVNDNLKRNKAIKYARAIYFKQRIETPKANLPSIAYTGFETLVNISTGVIRNLLIPCYKMYDKCDSKRETVQSIDPTIQYTALKEESENMWEMIKNLSVSMKDCDEKTALRIETFLKSFGEKLKFLLLDPNATEKQVLTFTIEQLDDARYKEYKNTIVNTLSIAEKAGLLYTRIGAGRSASRTTWYTPNRILWVNLGLDPVGQNGRINILPSEFISMSEKIIRKYEQGGLFSEEESHE